MHNHFQLYKLCSEYYLRCDWSLPMIYKSEYRQMDDVMGKLFFFVLCNTAHGFKMFARLISVYASESLQKRFAGAIYKEEKWRNQEKTEFLTTRKCLNWKRSSKHLPSCVIAMRKSQFWNCEGTEKLFGQTVYKYNKEEKKKQGQKETFVT